MLEEVNNRPTWLDKIVRSLAQQYLALLSQSFDKIGSLTLNDKASGWRIGMSPIVADQYDLYRDGVEVIIH